MRLSRPSRLTAVVLSLAFVGLGLTACSDDASPTADDRTITVYSGRSEELVAPIFEAFTAETGIKVEARYGDSAELAAQIIEEGDGSPADAFFSQDAGALGAVSNEELLGDLPADSVEAIPAEYRSTKGDWTGVTGRARVIAYNSDEVDAADVPASVFELTDPQYNGQVAIAPTNASFQAFITAMRVSEGEDVAQKWLEDMVANDVQTYDRNGLILDAVDAGEVTYGLINHYYWFEKADEVGVDALKAQLAFTEAGDPGSLVNVAGVGVLEGSITDPDSLAFVKFLLSPQTQALFVEETKEYALVPGVEQVEGLTPLDELQGPDVDLADLSSLPQTLEMLQEVGLT